VFDANGEDGQGSISVAEPGPPVGESTRAAPSKRNGVAAAAVVARTGFAEGGDVMPTMQMDHTLFQEKTYGPAKKSCRTM
jgi:hypothetical protein